MLKAEIIIDNYVSSDDVNKEINSLIGALQDPNITKEKILDIFKYLRGVLNIKLYEINLIDGLEEDEKIILNNFMKKLREIFFYNIRTFNLSESNEFLPTPMNEPIIELAGENGVEVKCSLNIPMSLNYLSPEEKNKLNNLIKNLKDKTSLLVVMFISFGTSIASGIIGIVLYFWKKQVNQLSISISVILLILGSILALLYFTGKNSGSRSLYFTKDGN